MKCIVCQADTEVLESRLSFDGLCVRRRRRCCVRIGDPHNFTSMEFSSAVINDMASDARIKDTMARRLRGFVRRAESERIRSAVEALARTPISNAAIAKEVKCSTTRVRQIRKELDL